jgi:hypothetical protein
MDFRHNWLAHFKHEVDEEVKAAHGNKVAGQTALAQKIEKSRDTVYQHYTQKSKKDFPTVEMMVALEKKYARGRPVGWSSQPLLEDAPQAAGGIDIEQALEALVARLSALPSMQREVVAQRLPTLVRAPDSKTVLREVLDAIEATSPSLLQLTSEQRSDLRTMMGRTPIGDADVAKHLPPAPNSEKDKN